jgi:AbrB family looped-hinge helix DNA binding protein
MAIDILSVSSKGQIVLPVEMRKKLGIEAGSKLAAYAWGDIIILKPIDIPTEDDFRKSLNEAAAWAKEAGYKEDDVSDIIKTYRKNRKTRE